MITWTDVPQFLIGELGRPTEMLSAAKLSDSKLSGSTLITKIKFPGKIVQVRVNGESNYE